MTAQSRRDLAEAVLIALGVCAFAWLSLTFARPVGLFPAFWPANAILIVALLNARDSHRNALAFVAGIGLVISELAIKAPIPTALIVSALNVAEALIATFAVTRLVGGRIDVRRQRDLIVVGAVGAIIAPAAPGLVAGALSSLAGGGDFFHEYFVWWQTHALGFLVVAPPLCVVAAGGDRLSIGRVSPLRTAVLLGFLVAGLAVVLLQRQMSLLFVMPVILVLIAFELGLTLAAWALLATAAFSLTALVIGTGPALADGADFATRSRDLQGFLAFLAFTTLPLASIIGVRGGLQVSLDEARDRADATTRQLGEAVDVASQAERIAGMGYWLYHPATREVSWSDGMYEIYGLDNDGHVPDFDTVHALFHPDDRRQMRDHTLRSLQTGEAYELQLRIQRGDETRWVIASTRCQYDAAGAVTVLIGTMIDVTSLRRTETALVESEIRYRSLADSVPDLILRLSPKGTITFASAASRRYGYEPADIVGRVISDFVHPDDLDSAQERYADNFSPAGIGGEIRREQRVRTADGQWIWLEGNPVQVRNLSGEVTEVVNALRDVTLRRAMEDELHQARMVAEQANRSKSEFLSNISHELRTPLAAIVGFADLLKHTGELGDRETQFVGRIATASTALHGLVNDILDFSKMEAGGVVLEAMPVVLDELIDESLSMVATSAASKGLALSAKIEGKLPSVFTGDPTKLRQVLTNLLSNAVKFTEKGFVRLSVSQSGEGRLTFMISDTGIGIPPDRIDSIFDRFTQADGSTTRSHGGTGLGLAICKGLVEAMGGVIVVNSRVGGGSTFCFSVAAPPIERPTKTSPA